MAINKIQKECEICKTLFTPHTINSIYCSKRCSDIAGRRKKAQKKKEEQHKQLLEKIPDDRNFITIQEAKTLFNVARNTLYRLVRQNKIPAINLGTRLIRIDRTAIENMFPYRIISTTNNEKPKAKLYSLEPEDCYTIGEVQKKFGVSEKTVHTHMRKYSIPMRQIGKFVYVPKSEIDNLYKGNNI